MTDKSQFSSRSKKEKHEQHQYEQGTDHPTRPCMPELTAEWTVRAHLTIGRPGETVSQEFNSNDQTNPVKVVYRWSTTEAKNDDDKRLSRETLVVSGQSTPLKTKGKHAESFNSTTSAGCGDSAFSGSNTSRNQQRQQQQTPQEPRYGARCRSTCNIIVSAVADFLPDNVDIPEEPDPFVFNTTSSYTVLPEQTSGTVSPAASKSFTSGKILALRDAFSQTSDTETRFFAGNVFRYPSRSPPTDRPSATDDYRRQIRRSYDRRTTEAMPPLVTSPAVSTASAYAEGNVFMPSYRPSPTQARKSASMPQIPPLPSQQMKPQTQQDPQSASKPESKKPRTVHIDVYCTGSDDGDESEFDECDTSSSSDANRLEVESNSTPQTVLDNEQMLLRHQRITGNVLPRRVQLHRDRFAESAAKRAMTGQRSPIHDRSVGHAVTKSSTAEEISQSKQLLFRKHIGDQRANKLLNLRNKYIRKEPSDDCISSNYPNSSRSTMRDTCSSISSVMASQETEDLDPSASVTKTDSFDYDNAVDRLRIKQMESLWARAENDVNNPPIRSHTQPMFLHPISEGDSQWNTPYTDFVQFQRNDYLPSESENFSESDNVFYPYYRQNSPDKSSSHLTPPSTSPLHPPRIVYSYPATIKQNPPAFLQFFGPKQDTVSKSTGIQPAVTTPATSAGLQRWKSEAREHLPEDTQRGKSTDSSKRASSEGPPSPPKSQSPPLYSSTSYIPVPINLMSSPSTSLALSPQQEQFKRESSESSSRVSTIQGYTSEHLQKARKFGAVIGTIRKPGHHIGPTKNPNCLCEHCQRWMAERFQIRTRAFSVGDQPIILKPTIKRGNI